MKCEKIQEILTQVAAGELPEEALDPVRKHLSACGQCRELLSDLREMEQAFDSFADSLHETAPLPEGFAGKVRGGIRRRRILSAVRRLAVAGAAAAVILVVTLLVINHGELPPVTPSDRGPQVVEAPEKDWLEGVEVPRSDKERLLLLGRLAGVESFELLWKKRTGRIIFVAPDAKQDFCGTTEPQEGEKRFLYLLAYCFPKARKVACKVTGPNDVNEFIVLR